MEARTKHRLTSPKSLQFWDHRRRTCSEEVHRARTSLVMMVCASIPHFWLAFILTTFLGHGEPKRRYLKIQAWIVLMRTVKERGRRKSSLGLQETCGNGSLKIGSLQISFLMIQGWMLHWNNPLCTCMRDGDSRKEWQRRKDLASPPANLWSLLAYIMGIMGLGKLQTLPITFVPLHHPRTPYKHPTLLQRCC